MPLRRRAWLTREGWYYLAVLAFIIGGAVLRSINLLVVLAGMMIGPLLFNWRLVMASLMGLVVRRELPAQVVAGDPLTVEITLENTRWWLSSWLVVVEDWVERQGTGVGNHESIGGNQTAGRQTFWELVREWIRPSRLFRSKIGCAEALIAHVPAHGKSIGTYRLT